MDSQNCSADCSTEGAASHILQVSPHGVDDFMEFPDCVVRELENSADGERSYCAGTPCPELDHSACPVQSAKPELPCPPDQRDHTPPMPMGTVLLAAASQPPRCRGSGSLVVLRMFFFRPRAPLEKIRSRMRIELAERIPPASAVVPAPAFRSRCFLSAGLDRQQVRELGGLVDETPHSQPIQLPRRREACATSDAGFEAR